MSQLPFAPTSVAFNRIYEPEISDALLSLLVSGVAFSIVVYYVAPTGSEMKCERGELEESISPSQMPHR